MEYYNHVWDGASISYLNLVDKLLKRECRAVCSTLTTSLEPLDHRRNMVSLVFSIVISLVDVHLNWMNCFPSLYSGEVFLLF